MFAIVLAAVLVPLAVVYVLALLTGSAALAALLPSSVLRRAYWYLKDGPRDGAGRPPWQWLVLAFLDGADGGRRSAR